MVQFTSVHVYYLLDAAKWTILLSLIAFAGGAVLGMTLALMRVSRLRAAQFLAAAVRGRAGPRGLGQVPGIRRCREVAGAGRPRRFVRETPPAIDIRVSHRLP